MSGTLPLTAEEKEKLKSLGKKFEKNSHDIFVLDTVTMVEFWYAAKRAQGLSTVQAQDEMHTKLSEWELESMWEKIKDVTSFAATYTASAIDIKLLTQLGNDMMKSGSLLTRYKINNYNGKSYIIFKGYFKAREIITGTRYLAANTKVVSMGIGKLGAAKAIAGGVKITLILTIGFRAIDTLMREEATWHYFVGSVSTDIIKVGISGGASFLAASIVASGAAVSVIAVGPLFAAIAVGILVGVALEYVDEKYGFTQALIEGLREADKNLQREMRELSRQWNWYHRSPESTVDFWMRVFGAQY